MARKIRSTFRARTPGKGPEISRLTLSRMEKLLRRYHRSVLSWDPARSWGLK